MAQAEHQQAQQDEAADTLPVPAEEVTAYAVTARREGALERSSASGVAPAVQAAAAAAGGFVAGAAVVGLVHRHRRRTLVKAGRRAQLRRGRGGRAGTAPSELLQIVGSRSLLLDVHLLGGSER